MARRGVGQGKLAASEIDLQREFGHVETDVEGGGQCLFMGNRHGIGSSLFMRAGRGKLLPRDRSGNCSSHNTRGAWRWI